MLIIYKNTKFDSPLSISLGGGLHSFEHHSEHMPYKYNYIEITSNITFTIRSCDPE